MKISYRYLAGIIILLVIIYFIFLTDDSYGNRMLDVIEYSEYVTIKNDEVDEMVVECDKSIHLGLIFSDIVDIRKPWNIFSYRYHEYKDTGIELEYKKGEKIYGRAKVYIDSNDRYISYMKGVYWKSEIKSNILDEFLKIE